MNRALAGDRAARRDRGPVAVDRGLRRLGDLRVSVEPDVVVGGEVDVGLISYQGFGACNAFVYPKEWVRNVEKFRSLPDHADFANSPRNRTDPAAQRPRFRLLPDRRARRPRRSHPRCRGELFDQARLCLRRQAEQVARWLHRLLRGDRFRIERRRSAVPGSPETAAASPPSWRATSAISSPSAGAVDTAAASRAAIEATLVPSASETSGRSTRSLPSRARRSSTAINESMPISDSGRSGSMPPAGSRKIVAASSATTVLRSASAASGPREASRSFSGSSGDSRCFRRGSPRTRACKDRQETAGFVPVGFGKRGYRKPARDHRRKAREGFCCRNRFAPSRRARASRVSGLSASSRHPRSAPTRPRAPVSLRPGAAARAPREPYSPLRRRLEPAPRPKWSPRKTIGTIRSDLPESGVQGDRAAELRAEEPAARGRARCRRRGCHRPPTRRARSRAAGAEPPGRVEHGGQRGVIGYIAAINAHLGASSFKLSDPASHPGVSAPRRPTRAIEPAPRATAIAPPRIRTLRPRRSPDRFRPGAPRRRWLGQPHAGVVARNQHQLADMPGRLHQPEGIVELGIRENPVRQGPDRALGQRRSRSRPEALGRGPGGGPAIGRYRLRNRKYFGAAAAGVPGG